MAKNPFNRKDLGMMSKHLNDMNDLLADARKLCELNIPGMEEFCGRAELAKKQLETLKTIFFAKEI